MMQAHADGGGAREIVPRPMNFAFSKATPHFWMDGDPFTTHLMNALSLTFPDGERFFVAAVRDLREHARTPELQQQVRGFLAQESLHRREHDSFNRLLRAQGVDVDRFYAEVAALLARPEQNGTPLLRLAITCALEHFTAIMAEMWLTRDLRLEAHESVRDLWSWHAIEELDHKAVAFDVYVAAGGSYALRVTTMVAVSFAFFAKASELQARLMKHDGQAGNLRSWLRGAWKFWGPRGYFSRLVPAYLRYFDPNFHPWQQDDSQLIARFERELAARSVARAA
jgi:uncharacterized protein